jgi:hypothetical protein
MNIALLIASISLQSAGRVLEAQSGKQAKVVGEILVASSGTITALANNDVHGVDGTLRVIRDSIDAYLGEKSIVNVVNPDAQPAPPPAPITKPPVAPQAVEVKPGKPVTVATAPATAPAPTTSGTTKPAAVVKPLAQTAQPTGAIETDPVHPGGVELDAKQ